MLGLLSAWLGLIAAALAAIMVAYRPAFNDLTIVIVLQLCAPLSLTCAGIIAWQTRHQPQSFAAARLQAKVGAALSLAAIVVVYVLIHLAQALEVS